MDFSPLCASCAGRASTGPGWGAVATRPRRDGHGWDPSMSRVPIPTQYERKKGGESTVYQFVGSPVCIRTLTSPTAHQAKIYATVVEMSNMPTDTCGSRF